MNVQSESVPDQAGPVMQPSAERVADLQAEKQALRQQLARVRELLDPKQATAWSEAIGQQLLASKLLTMFSSDQLDPATPIIKKTPEIGLFNAMRQEVDFQPVWQTLRSRGFRLCFPRMIRSEGRTDLEFLAMPDQLDPASLLVQSHFGVREPAAATPQNGLVTCDPDLILLPGLGFDRAGNRLGWGQGYYDHYLARRLAQNPSDRPILVGIAYPFQILSQIPAGDRDIPVDYLLSPDGLIKTQRP